MSLYPIRNLPLLDPLFSLPVFDRLELSLSLLEFDPSLSLGYLLYLFYPTFFLYPLPFLGSPRLFDTSLLLLVLQFCLSANPLYRTPTFAFDYYNPYLLSPLPATYVAKLLADAARRSRFADVPVYIRVYYASSVNVATNELPYRGFGVSAYFYPPLTLPIDVYLT